ncbi:hypothetical protein O8C80_02875 [Aliarcobacter butzleri]|uniref:hypothetical protein n=1 Tax=Aliarcobacter butzleri TaxID=28197 RepID=UPI00263C1EE4|nr:hypothetical protein [Aliarcobacter butzleri]MDN5042272.1 hypothetical protein [Aliarcobacter butzleri]
MGCNIDILSNKVYSKIYKSKKKINEQLFFKVDFNISIYEDLYKKINISINAKISYLVHFKENKYFETYRITNSWDLTSLGSYKSCSLNDSIMIHTNFRSFGIGSFLLNEILFIANKHIPDYSLEAFLSPVDEYEENKERRNKLYTSIGFNIEPNKLFIDKLSNLNFNRKFDYIEVLDEYKIADLFYKISIKNKDLKNENTKLKKRVNYYKNENIDIYKSLRKHKRIIFILVLILIVLSWKFICI